MTQLTDPVWSAVARIATGWTVLILWLIVIAYYWYFFGRHSYLPARTFDERWEGFGPARVPAILAEFDEAKLARYRSQASTFDMLFPVLYSAAAAAALVFFAPNLRYRWLVLLPFAMAIFDWLENIAVVRVIGLYRANAALGSWPVMLVIAQRLKFLFFGATLAVLLVAGGLWTWRMVRS